jgi:hypothetical protein
MKNEVVLDAEPEFIGDVSSLEDVSKLFPRFRLLPTGQRAAYAVDCAPLFEEQARQRQREIRKQRRVGGIPELTRLIQQLASRALNVSRSSIRRAAQIKLQDIDVFYELKAGVITLEEARRRIGVWKPTRPKSNGIIVHNQQQTIERKERAERIRKLAAEGHRAAQIADIEKLHTSTVKRIASAFSIELPDQVCGRARRAFNVNRCTEEAVGQVVHFRIFVDLIRSQTQGLDRSKIPDWVEQLKDSRRTISELITLLEKNYEKD